jgi:hypothetical protein
MFGKERFKEVVRKNARLETESIRKAVFEAVTKFRGDEPQEDDITLVVLKFSRAFSGSKVLGSEIEASYNFIAQHLADVTLDTGTTAEPDRRPDCIFE